MSGLVVLMLLCAFPVWAQSILLDKDEDRIFSEFNWLPYAFFSESFGMGVGAGAAYSGWPTEPASVLGAATVGTRGSYNVAIALSDYQLPGLPRIVAEPFLMTGLYHDQRVYAGRNPEFPGERPGANGSSEGNFLEVIQWDTLAELRLHYLLPIGDGRDNIVHRYIIDRGFLIRRPSGGNVWNPLTSGRTRISVIPTWREKVHRNKSFPDLPLRTLNLEFVLEYDNRDFPFNPTRGSVQRVVYQKDFDGDERFGGWEKWSAEFRKLVDLGTSGVFRQRVIALDFWTAYVPTWKTEQRGGETVVTRRPPYFEGAVLGGVDRMRGYEDFRWQDKAAIYYSAEYRVVPKWQPLQNYRWLEWAAIQYWQWVVFAEAGQVASDYRISDLHSDLRFDAGVGLRGMVHKAVVRLDIAFGEEGGRVIAMYGHPF